MVSANGRKRRYSEDDGGLTTNEFGVAATLAHLNGPADEDSKPDEQAWQTVERRPKKKKSKTEKLDAKHNYPGIVYSPQHRLTAPVKLRDIQLLILYLVASGDAPQWIAVRHRRDFRKVVVLTVPGLEMGLFDGSISLDQQQPLDAAPSQNEQESADKHSPDSFYPKELVTDSLPEALHPLSAIFDRVWPVQTPGDRFGTRMHSPLQAILTAPLQKPSDHKKNSGPQPPRYATKWVNQPTHVTQFVANLTQLRDDDYLVHPAMFESDDARLEDATRRNAANQSSIDGWVDSTSSSVPSKPRSIDDESMCADGMRVLAVDCEMCKTSADDFDLTRISIVDWDGRVVMDELVLPDKPITDYVTQYSGITAEKLAGVTTSRKDIQTRLLTLLTPTTILVGHSLNSDLNAIRITHPLIIDTAIIYPHPRGPPLKSSLKFLAQKYLSRDIQSGQAGHDSIEDARAALDLVRLKCQKGPKWGTDEANGESLFTQISRSNRPDDVAVHNFSACVDWGAPHRGHGAAADIALGCATDEQVVANVQRCVRGDADGSRIPRRGADFVWARLRGLEAVRGWWTAAGAGPDTKAAREAAIAQAGPDATLEQQVARTVQQIKAVWDALPACTAFVVYSGNGDPRELGVYQDMHRQHRQEYATKKWDDLSIKWTDQEQNAMRAANEKARSGIGFVAVK